MTTKQKIEIAFRKLKASVYFDKTALALRDKVVSFESDTEKPFKDELGKIAEAYDQSVLGDDSDLMREILDSLKVLTFPKKMCSQLNESELVINVGTPKKEAQVEECQHFIDMDVRGHILGILWILEFGKSMDDRCFKNSHGNKLRKDLIWDEDGEIIDSSPALFEPYFAQYQKWRDNGLECAEELLNKKHDALILTLDLKRFYYKTGITQETFVAIAENESKERKSLHNAVFLILEKYTEVLSEKTNETSGIALPIGFLPSAVLANWCLEKFDQGILDFWNPSYYGRYVDDIIIVDKLEKDSEIYKKAHQGTLNRETVIEYFLGEKRREKALHFAKRKGDKIGQLSFEEANVVGEKEYRVAEPFCLSESSVFEFQARKTRIYTLFSDNNSAALIYKFKKEIYENISEFRFMPQIGDAFTQDDFSDFYRIENDETINKLRGVKDVVVDKYELSKFLGRYRVVSGLVDDVKLREFTTTISKMFNNSELIGNYTIWERIFEIFITDKDYKGFAKFANKVTKAINSIKVGQELENCVLEEIKTSLNTHLTSVFNRVLSLIWGVAFTEITKNVKVAIKFELRKAYLKTHMVNKYVMVIPTTFCDYFCENDNFNLTNFNEVFTCLSKKSYETLTKAKLTRNEFLPFFQQAQDIAMSSLLHAVCCERSQSALSNYIWSEIFNQEFKDAIEISSLSNVNRISQNVLKPSDLFGGCTSFSIEQKELFDSRNIDMSEFNGLFSEFGKPNHDVIFVSDMKSNKLKIAVANVNVSDYSDLEKILKNGVQNRKHSRYKALSDLVNVAIKEKADMLVLPECYVPIEWIRPLSSKASREGIAIITGVEHIVVGKNVYNFTAVILPFKYRNTIPTAAVFFQLKKHYSPDEERVIEGYGYKAVESNEQRPLYCWKDCYFPVYCCYELTNIKDRAEFMSLADMIVAVEWNKDTNYFGNIIDSLARDMHCYCVQVNTSEYGDSRITQPAKTEKRNILAVKGGANSTLLIGEVDIQSLREFQIKNYELQKDGVFKPTPPDFNRDVVRGKIEGKFRKAFEIENEVADDTQSADEPQEPKIKEGTTV